MSHLKPGIPNLWNYTFVVMENLMSVLPTLTPSQRCGVSRVIANTPSSYTSKKLRLWWGYKFQTINMSLAFLWGNLSPIVFSRIESTDNYFVWGTSKFYIEPHACFWGHSSPSCKAAHRCWCFFEKWLKMKALNNSKMWKYFIWHSKVSPRNTGTCIRAAKTRTSWIRSEDPKLTWETKSWRALLKWNLFHNHFLFCLIKRVKCSALECRPLSYTPVP